MSQPFSPLQRPLDLSCRLQQGDVELARFLMDHAGATWTTEFAYFPKVPFSFDPERSSNRTLLSLALSSPNDALWNFLLQRPHEGAEAENQKRLALRQAGIERIPTENGSDERLACPALHYAFQSGNVARILWVMEHEKHTFTLAEDPSYVLRVFANAVSHQATLDPLVAVQKRFHWRTEQWCGVIIGASDIRATGKSWGGVAVPFPLLFSAVAEDPEEAVSWFVHALGVSPHLTTEKNRFSWFEWACFKQNLPLAAALIKHGATPSEKTQEQIASWRNKLIDQQRKHDLNRTVHTEAAGELAALNRFAMELAQPQPEPRLNQWKRSRM